MGRLTLTRAALDVIIAYNEAPVDTGAFETLPDGRFVVDFGDATVARLNEGRRAGEDDSQMILRLFREAMINRRGRSADGGHRLAGLRR